MLTTVEALKKVYVSFGGQLSDVENMVTIPDIVQALSELEISSKPLTVTDDGNGNVEIKLGQED